MTREEKEMRSLFEDPKFTRQAWRALANTVLASPPVPPLAEYDRSGNETQESVIRTYTYRDLAKDCKKAGRAPTTLEYILRCQAALAATDVSAFVALRDTAGARPIDESKVDQTLSVNQYETLTDEELELLAAYRQKKQEEEKRALLQSADEAAFEAMPDKTDQV